MKLKSNIIGIFTFFIGMFLVIGLLPIMVMLIKSLYIDGNLTLEYYYSLFSSRHAWLLFFNSLKLSTLTTLFALLAGIPLGILCGKTDLPGRRLFIILFAIPLLIPPYIMAVAWFNIFGRAGFLSQIGPPSLAEYTSLWLFGLPGCVLVLSSVFMPIVMVLTITYLKSINPHLEEAARLAARWPLYYCQNCPAIDTSRNFSVRRPGLHSFAGRIDGPHVSALRCVPGSDPGAVFGLL